MEPKRANDQLESKARYHKLESVMFIIVIIERCLAKERNNSMGRFESYAAPREEATPWRPTDRQTNKQLSLPQAHRARKLPEMVKWVSDKQAAGGSETFGTCP